MFADLGIHHVRRMPILLPVACMAVQYFSTLSHKRQGFRINVIEHEICVLIFYTILSETFLTLKEK